jgi:hypothetical protein
MKLSKKKGLAGLVLIAFMLRALFLLYGASRYYSMPVPFCYAFGDAQTYMQAAENLINDGHYTFDYLEPDAAYGRLPGYPMFYGVHYLLFGAGRAIYATAWSQVVLDSFAVLLVFGIMCRLTPALPIAAWVGAALYAAYPFIIFWAPMLFTELIATDVSLLIIYFMLRYSPSGWRAIILGVLVAIGLFTREYLGLFLPIALLWAVWTQGGFQKQQAWQAALLVGLGFGLLYIGWPIRNYLQSGHIVLLKPKTAGYASHKADVDEFRSWVHCWDNNENLWFDKVIRGKGPVDFPDKAFANAQEREKAQTLVEKARTCGSSFFMMREAVDSKIYGFKEGAVANSIYAVYRDTAFMMHDPTYLFYRNHNCNNEISTGFLALRKSYAQRDPWGYWFDVPIQNLKKAFFKTGLSEQGNSGGIKLIAVKLLFAYRSLLLLLGLLGVWLFRKESGVWPIMLYFSGMVFFICFLMRNLEMRYLLQADVLMLLPASMVLGKLITVLVTNRKRPEDILARRT